MINLKDKLHDVVYVPVKDGKLSVCLYVGEMQWWKPIIEVEPTEIRNANTKLHYKD